MMNYILSIILLIFGGQFNPFQQYHFLQISPHFIFLGQEPIFL